ncbi:MAG: hypothetical protein WC644_08685 [Ignavibacteria bacterium]
MNSKIYNAHTFHIPVMGIGFTIDTPIKTAHLGISSVISLVDDILIEKMRKNYCKLNNIEYYPITMQMEDYRAKRITAYLNLVNEIVVEKFNNLKKSEYTPGSELDKYFDLLPDNSELKINFKNILKLNPGDKIIHEWIRNNIVMGSIDVNIMTKLDKANYINKEQMLPEFNDAHAALRGFANSNLESSVVLSAGVNTRLYGYFENFKDFYPDINGKRKKKIILKISDYRSAYIQSKIFAKKGLWISEFRLESGLNCGGHAFATDGYLMGPVLEEIKNNRDKLKDNMHELMCKSLRSKRLFIPEVPFELKITAQGGIGTAEEHNYLLNKYNLDSIGWGTPFLLVPEVTNVDKDTSKLLCNAKEDDLYLSRISPLGVPFNSLRNNTKDIEKNGLADKGRPGSSCPEKYCSLNTEFTEQPICTASRQFQKIKIAELNEKNLDSKIHFNIFDRIVEKACLCVGLSTSALIVNNLDTKKTGQGVSICPGPNMAYFSEIVSLKKMVDHIYGKVNIIKRKDRPNLFIKELELYINYFRELADSISDYSTEIQIKHIEQFRKNINEGIIYYKSLFNDLKSSFEIAKSEILNELERFENELKNIEMEYTVSLVK